MKKQYLTAFLMLVFVSLQAQNQSISLKASPSNIYIEADEHAQYLNFEFLLQNASSDTLTLQNIAVDIFDKAQNLVARKYIGSNGFVPSIQTLPERVLKGKSQLTVFNPFHTFEKEMDLNTLQYEFTLVSTQKKEQKIFVTVKPSLYQTKTPLALPLKGKILVEDGHDFYAHHRRFNYAHPFLQSLGFRSNFMRYSYDFVTLDAKGESHTGDSEKNENWDCFGKPIYAPAAGKIVAIVDSMLDNRSFDESKIAQNQMILFGNYIVIDHQNGEFSLFAHLKKGSSQVKIGDMVKANQSIAAIGASGSANIPHLHYELRTNANHLAEGLPSYFTGYTQMGKKIKKGQIDSGDIIENK